MPPTVLLVEDQVPALELFREILEAAGFIVLASKNPAAAILRCVNHPGPIDLIVTDLKMPKMSGTEMIERIAEVLRPAPPCVFVSGYPADAHADSSRIAELVRHGSAVYLMKPFSGSSLVDAARQLTRRTFASSAAGRHIAKSARDQRTLSSAP